MSNSQFILYQSSDAGAPVLSGTTGSLIAVLDACLVNGYGSKAAAGWTKTFAGTSTGVYKMGSGTGFSLAVNDAGPGAGTFEEAWACGWEVCTGAPSGTTLGTGSGQFPNPLASQGTVTPFGFVVVRKSNALSSAAKGWFIFADNRTLYMGVLSDSAIGYCFWSFGDIYSIAPGDIYNCHITGRLAANSASFSSEAGSRQAPYATFTTSSMEFLARTFGGGGTSIGMTRQGDLGKNGNQNLTSNAGIFGGNTTGTIATPNTADNSYYVSPIWVFESATGIVRGRWRGVWHLCHPYTLFSDGQTMTGANDVLGKTFMIRLQIIFLSNGGCLMFETSNTVETN